jgi:oxygen-independent coproporphyrinogen-3 oxidase
VSHDHRQIDHYLDALEREVTIVSERLGGRRRLQQVHLGGGTPNYLSDIQLVRLVDILDRRFIIDEATETSLEANAHRASLSQLTLLHGLGFRNLNLEVRDLDEKVQETLGRHQSLPVVRDVVENARNIGFTSVSTDLVYGLPCQTASSITRTIKQLLSLEPDRVACYTYSRRPDRFQHQRAVDQTQMPSLADKVAIFSRIVDGFCGDGYEWIGLDCFARPDDRIAQAHKAGQLHRNWIGYTAQPGRSILGFGSSSVSELSTICVQNHPDIEAWRERLEQGELPVRAGQIMSPAARARRHALSDLMCNLQIDNAEQLTRDGEEGDPALLALRDDGFVEISGNRVSITEAGRYSLHQLWGDSSPSYRWGQFS